MGIEIAGLVATGLGAITSAVGAIGAGQAQAQAASYQAAVARNNATIASQNAAYATKAGEAQAVDASLRARARTGEAAAQLAASGVDVNSGSAADVQKSSRELGNLDTARTMQNAQLQAYGYRSQAANFQADAQLETAKAQEAPIAGAFTAGGDLLSGASSLGSKWTAFQDKGGSSVWSGI